MLTPIICAAHPALFRGCPKNKAALGSPKAALFFD